MKINSANQSSAQSIFLKGQATWIIANSQITMIQLSTAKEAFIR